MADHRRGSGRESKPALLIAFSNRRACPKVTPSAARSCSVSEARKSTYLYRATDGRFRRTLVIRARPVAGPLRLLGSEL